MVHFKDCSKKGQNLLVIYGDESKTPTIELAVHSPLSGKYSTRRPQSSEGPKLDHWTEEGEDSSEEKAIFLKSATHAICPDDKVTFPTLGRQIISGAARWGPYLRAYGEFPFTLNYWDWLDDVIDRCSSTLRSASLYDPVMASRYRYECNGHIFRAFCEAWCSETNTLHTSVGELSISLYDLDIIGGLSTLGGIYDECIPSAKELLDADDPNGPRSCQYLFAAYYLISRQGGTKNKVSFEDWIAYWFKGDQPKSQPPVHKSKGSGRHEASSSHKDWPDRASKVFLDLKIKDRLQGETYLAAFLSCWLCSFVLPEEGSVIRPSTFRMASMMAMGTEICLSIPVLTSIYKALHKIANSTTPGKSYAYFPAHYLYGWLACYFRTLTPNAKNTPNPKMLDYAGADRKKEYTKEGARNLVHLCAGFKWGATVLKRRDDITIVDNEKLSKEKQAYFISARSCYLTLRSGNFFFVEPYNPSRFARQIGFCQDIPHELDQVARTSSLDTGFDYWRWSTRLGTNSVAVFPQPPSHFEQHTSSTFLPWWKKVNGDYLIKEQDLLVKSTSSEKKGKEDDPVETILPTKRKIVGAARLPGKRIINASDGESSSDHDWKHKTKKKKGKDDLFGLDNIPDNIGCSSVPIEVDQLNDVSLYVANEDSIGSTGRGFNKFDLVLQNHEANKEHLKPKDVAPKKKSVGGSKAMEAPKSKVPSIIPSPAAPSTTSVWPGEAKVSAFKRAYLLNLWSMISEQLSNTSFESVQKVEAGIEATLRELDTHSNLVDTSMLRRDLADYFGHTRIFREKKLTALSTSGNSDKTLLEEKKKELEAITIQSDSSANFIKSSKERKEIILKEIERLTDEDKELSVSIAQEELKLSQFQVSLTAIEEQISNIASRPLEDDNLLKDLEVALEQDRKDILNFKLFP